MTQQTLTALFDTRSDATTAVNELVKAGIPRTSIRMTPESDAASTTTTRTSYDTSRDEKGFWASLRDMFIPEDDRHTYAEAMHRGSILVGVTVDEAHAARAEDILEQYGTVDIQEREASYRQQGWTGGAASRPGAAGGLATATPNMGVRKGMDNSDVIPVVEEQLKVGKRQVNKGRVKVRSYAVETPVSEQVSLRTETVHVERRPMDRAAAVGEDAFKERTFEATATSEEPVVSKQVRVTGEVALTKDVEQRTQTVSDTVRSTKVDVEDDRATAKKPASGAPPRR
jgi:uncharacterized protein (TIGR02271 family)